ncbi:MAG: isocitrate lyase/phosphoenolpyruvate mutase family protein, partial [Burkholderiales bacterium]
LVEPGCVIDTRLVVGADLQVMIARVVAHMDAGGPRRRPDLPAQRREETDPSMVEIEVQQIAGVHIEDQLFPKRAHYHTYVAHNIPINEFRDKIRMACEQRDKADKAFIIIARSDACREQGYKEAVKRMLMSRDQGADMGLIFPRTPEETKRAPKDCKLPMVYVQSRGNRDGRPLYSFKQLEDMGYAGSIDAILSVGVQFHFMRKALLELRRTGDYTGIKTDEYITARKQIEDLIGLEEYYKIEEETVEKMYKKENAKKKR